MLLLIAAAILADSPGPVFFRSKRVGKHGKIFCIWKFRTMQISADEFSTRHMPRITRFGRFLRRTNLDEVPQVFNVLMGHMSFVGPRAEIQQFAQFYSSNIPHYDLRYSVKPGVTGWAQLKNHYSDDILEDAEKRLFDDLYYAKHRSLFFELRILIKTVALILFRRGD